MDRFRTLRASSPKHEAIREYVRGLIQSQQPGDPAPSERELVHRFGVARMTARQALDALEAEGLLDRIAGRGTFVAKPRRRTTPIRSFTEEMANRGHAADSQTVFARREPASGPVGRILGVDEGTLTVHWRRLRSADGTPVCLIDTWMVDAAMPEFLLGALPASLYVALAEMGMRPTRADDTISMAPATSEEATMLETEPGSLLARVQRRAFHRDTVVEVSKSAWRAENFQLRMHVGTQD